MGLTLANATLGAGIASPIIQSGGGIISSYLNYGYNKKLAAQQNQYNIDMWNMQNAYNSPQAQMDRLTAAGINPYIAAQDVTGGNASSAPQMVTPPAPQLDKHLSKIGEAFNIIGLKKALAEADNAETDAKRNKLDLMADISFGRNWIFDSKKGTYVQRPLAPGEIDVVPEYNWLTQKKLFDAYLKGELIPYRRSLLDWQKNYLVPQVHMSNYEDKHFPINYWIGTGSKAAGAIGNILNPFKGFFNKK